MQARAAPDCRGGGAGLPAGSGDDRHVSWVFAGWAGQRAHRILSWGGLRAQRGHPRTLVRNPPLRPKSERSAPGRCPGRPGRRRTSAGTTRPRCAAQHWNACCRARHCRIAQRPCRSGVAFGRPNPVRQERRQVRTRRVCHCHDPSSRRVRRRIHASHLHLGIRGRSSQRPDRCRRGLRRCQGRQHQSRRRRGGASHGQGQLSPADVIPCVVLACPAVRLARRLRGGALSLRLSVRPGHAFLGTVEGWTGQGRRQRHAGTQQSPAARSRSRRRRRRAVRPWRRQPVRRSRAARPGTNRSIYRICEAKPAIPRRYAGWNGAAQGGAQQGQGVRGRCHAGLPASHGPSAGPWDAATFPGRSRPDPAEPAGPIVPGRPSPPSPSPAMRPAPRAARPGASVARFLPCHGMALRAAAITGEKRCRCSAP